ncbi:MAG: hypothetical protein ACOY3E_15805 [Pseudomonadota bacterium]
MRPRIGVQGRDGIRGPDKQQTATIAEADFSYTAKRGFFQHSKRNIVRPEPIGICGFFIETERLTAILPGKKQAFCTTIVGFSLQLLAGAAGNRVTRRILARLDYRNVLVALQASRPPYSALVEEAW